MLLPGALACEPLDRFQGPAPCPNDVPRCHNRPPTVPVVELRPLEPTELDELRCELARPSTDPDGDALTTLIVWRRDGQLTEHEGATLAHDHLFPGETWDCVVRSSDGLAGVQAVSNTVEIRAAGSAALSRWIAEQKGGWCASEYNQLLNLCGEVEFCFDPSIMRTYPDGLAIDVGFHWDGEPGFLLDLGGDCDGKRLTLNLYADGTLRAEEFVGGRALEGRLSQGPHLISFHASRERRALYVDGVMVDEAMDSNNTPELLGACGPGFVLGQRLSYWWEPGKRGTWLRNAPFLVHVRARAEPSSELKVRAAITPGPDTVAFFDASGVASDTWTSRSGSLVGWVSPGTRWVDDVATECLVGNRTPRAPVVALSPAAPREGEAIRCDVTGPSFDADGDTVSYAFEWLEDGELTAHVGPLLPAQTTRAFERWSCRVTPSDGAGSGPAGDANAAVRAWPPCHAVAMTSSVASVQFQETGYGLGGGPYTFELWLRVPESPNQDRLARLLTLNEAYVDGGILWNFDPRTGVLSCSTYRETPLLQVTVTSARLDDHEWHHIACSQDGDTLRLWTDGRVTDSQPGQVLLEARSSLAMGQASGYAAQPAMIVDLGPFRVSRSVRYGLRFDPASDWSVDDDTVSQHLVQLGLSNDVLFDEVGGDNGGQVRRDVIALPAGRCP